MAYQIGAMIVGLLLLAAASLWGINALHQDFGSAIRGYQELRQVYEVGSYVATARTLLSLEKPDETGALRQLRTADASFGLFSPDIADGSSRKAQLWSAVRSGLREAEAHLLLEMTDGRTAGPASLVRPLNGILKDISDLATEIRKNIEQRQEAAAQKRRATLLAMSLLAALVITGAVLIGLLEYRSVTRPLSRLSEGVRNLAQGKLSQRIEPIGHAEFVSLAADFNRMAGELDELYRQLEQKVAEKSKELVRSERLASVGFLAAGVAHEINNPIGIIAAHAEFCLQQLQRNPTPPAITEAEKTLTVISEEAFRCKQIVEKLLSLARPGEDRRQLLCLGAVAADVVAMIGGLKEYRDRRLNLQLNPQDDVSILASEGEMKQVILNLCLNALQATDGGGQVTLRVQRKEKLVELVVEDNGKGMGPEVLEHVFEPFFTAQRGAGKPGTGLGLSISHAIISGHGGRIAAYSQGEGQGSRFVVQLPAGEKP